MVDSLSEFFDRFPARVTPQRLGAWRASVVMDVTGDDGGRWLIAVSGGRMTVSRDIPEAADTTVLVGAPELQQIIAGTMNPNMAFMTGKLKVRGDVGHAIKLSGLLTIR